MESGNAQIRILALGAGQDVGRSCVLVTLGGKTVMFDAGIHMLYSDHRRYPDFASLYTPPNTILNAVDLVLITHFHLDHCGALPFLTEYHNYSGPVIASTPTKAMIPFMLEDYRKVSTDVRPKEREKEKDKESQSEGCYIYSANEVRASAAKVRGVGLQETLTIAGIKITSYYAGHVLGAVMWQVEYGGVSAVYTGDYNSYADRHLGAARIGTLRPSVVLTETTYATTIRDTKRQRERAMLRTVMETVQGGGKVLIPVFALGRAQELSVLLESYWLRTDSQVPIYFSAGLIEKANLFYKLFVDWQNERIQQQFGRGHNVFEFRKVRPFDKGLIRAETPYVLFATPGMLHGGTSMQVFKEWCGDERNTLVIPGYCVQGTLGHKLLRGVKQITIDKKVYEVKMKIVNVSFSAHADAKGIVNLLRNLDPQNIVFVHGDKQKMEVFADVVRQQLQAPVFMPANHQPLLLKAKTRQIFATTPALLPPTGYLIRPKSTPALVIPERLLLKELNRMRALLTDPTILLHDPIECEFHLQNPSIDAPFLNLLLPKYEGTLQVANLEIKSQQQSIKQEGQQIILNGRLQVVANFLKELKALRRKDKDWS